MSNKPISNISKWNNEAVAAISTLQRFWGNVVRSMKKNHNLSGVMAISPRPNFTVSFIIGEVALQYYIGMLDVPHRKDGYPTLYVPTWFIYNEDQTVYVELGAPREKLDDYAVLPDKVADAIYKDYRQKAAIDFDEQTVEF